MFLHLDGEPQVYLTRTINDREAAAGCYTDAALILTTHGNSNFEEVKAMHSSKVISGADVKVNQEAWYYCFC